MTELKERITYDAHDFLKRPRGNDDKANVAQS